MGRAIAYAGLVVVGLEYWAVSYLVCWKRSPDESWLSADGAGTVDLFHRRRGSSSEPRRRQSPFKDIGH